MILLCVLGFANGVVGAYIALRLTMRRNQAEMEQVEKEITALERLLAEKKQQTEAEIRASIR